MKKILSIILTIIFCLSIAGTSLAAKCKGTVVSNEKGQIVIMVDKKCKLKEGDKVTVKTKKVVLEGC